MNIKDFENKEMLIINQDSGYLMIDLANAFTERGFFVTLLTGRLVIRNHKLRDSVTVNRIVRYNRKSKLSRLITWTAAFLQILFLVLIRYRDKNLLIVTNPPFALFLPIFVRNRYSILVFDVFPDAIAELGLMKKDSMLIRLWEKLNQRIFSGADNIIVITEGMRDLVGKYSGQHPVEVIPLWSDNGYIKPIDPDLNPFVRKYGLSDKFVVMYSGNIGISQNLETMLEIAKLCRNRQDIVFLIIGEGVMKYRIEEEVKTFDLKNCMIIPWQAPGNIPFSMAASDLAVITVGRLASAVAIPSKFYNFLSAGSPILGIAPEGSEVAEIIRNMNVGKCFDPSEKYPMRDFILSLADNKKLSEEYKNNSLRAAKHFTSENAKKAVLLFQLPINKSIEYSSANKELVRTFYKLQ